MRVELNCLPPKPVVLSSGMMYYLPKISSHENIIQIWQGHKAWRECRVLALEGLLEMTNVLLFKRIHSQNSSFMQILVDGEKLHSIATHRKLL